MRILVTGVKGQLGHDVVNECTKRGIEAIGVDVEEMDITDAAAVDRVITESKVDAVIHCAAYTAVDMAEDNPEVCRKVNVGGPGNIAKTCSKLGIKMLYISTEYVFNGEGVRPWEPEDKPAPLSVYGQSKYDGELEVQKNLDKYFIVRISWAFGLNGKNFVRTMINLSKTRNELNVVNDQIGSPTYTLDVAVALVDMIQTDKFGIYHVTNENWCSWYEFACAIFKEAGIDMKVNPVTTAEYPAAKAKRPMNSRMSKEKLIANGFKLLPTWQDALKRYINELRNCGEI
ncbi:MAG: dTDP-4-dehydrorhamnose reductase [Lachnospiraceae bacterium]|nr:dTDP-4-dehydrorhamnose reductase [Lachnospiraceae bacterium]